MKIKNIYRGLIPLIFFSVFSCYSQQSLRNLAYFEDKPAKLELITKKPLSDILLNGKSRNGKIEETISLNFPFSNEIRELFNFYYNLSDGYQEFKKLRDSFTSYKVINSKNISTKLYLVNVGSFRNFNDYGLLLSLEIKPEIF